MKEKILEIINNHSHTYNGMFVITGGKRKLADDLEELFKDSSQLEPSVGKLLLSEIRKHYLVEIDTETGEPKADIKTLIELWDKVNKYLEIKTVG